MKNSFKKGFTLTELLAVIIIIGVILLIALPKILGLISNESENISKTMEDVILKAGELYVHDNSDNFPEAEGNLYCVPFDTLIENDYLADKLTDPVTNEDISTSKFVKVSVKYGNYEYAITDTCESVEVVEDRPYIFVLKQTPSNTEYAQSKEIKVKYLSKKQENSHYYIKVSEVISVNNVVSVCGEQSLPGVCSSITTSILNPNYWYEVADNTVFTINKNMTIHAIMKNNDNYSKGVVYKETKIDNTPPNVAIKLGTMYTDRVEAKAICTDDISGIVKHEFSNDNGITWYNTLKQNTYEFTGLTQNTNYVFTVKCTNGAGISETQTTYEFTKNIVKPVIKQASQIPTDTTTYPTYASERKIKITYSGTNVKNPEYYFKSTIDATVASGVVTSSCGTSTNPSNCSASAVTTLVANTWYKTSSTTPVITYEKNGALYAMTKDPSDNKASATTYSIVNMDTTPPEANLSFTNVKTDRITLIATCSDNISGVVKYEFSKDNGATWINTGTTNRYTYTGLTQGTSYKFAIRCTNGADLKNTIINSKTLPVISNPIINQFSQLPTNTGIFPKYASERKIKITYSGTNVENPSYYFKSTIDATVESNIITHSCGSETVPTDCSSTTVTTLVAGMWYKSNTTTPIITYTKNGSLYAMTKDPSDNSAFATTYSIVNMDTTPPTATMKLINVKTDRVTVNATCSDDISGIVYYHFSNDDGATWMTTTSSASTYTYTFIGLTQNTEYKFKTKCTNGAGLESVSDGSEKTKEIIKPSIIQIGKLPSDTSLYPTYAYERIIQITYNGANIQTPEYYFKSTVEATVASGVITHSCGNDVNPGSCSSKTVTKLETNTWYKTNDSQINVTYTANGALYAQTWDPSDNKAEATTYSVVNMDTTEPIISVQVFNVKTDRATVGATCSDDISGIVKYEFSKDNGTTWVTYIANRANYSHTFTGLTQGTEYKFVAKCTNGAALTSKNNSNNATATITPPSITQTSQLPEDTTTYPTYASKRVITITYYSNNIVNPKYYYSQDGENWTEVTSGITKEFTYTENGKLYAKTLDETGNVATASTYVITNMDTTAPTTSIEITSKKTDRATIKATCSDNISGITKYEFSKDNGATWVSYKSSNANYAHTFTGLTQNTSYTFVVRCTNGAALTKTTSITDTIPLIQDVKIEQASETKTAGYDYATKRVIKITYIGTNIENPGYYFKSSVKATVASGVITHNCKTGTVPNTSSCTTSSVTTLEPDIWYKTSSTTPNITYDNNGSLYAITIDPSNNQSTTATYTISKVDSTVPTVSMEISNIKTDRATIKATCSDTESGITKYQYSKDNGSTWIDNGTTASYTFTGLSQGSSYTFAIKCTNGSALTKTSSLSKTIATITAPAIVQISQVPTKSDEFPTYAQTRTIRITYYPDNIESPKYYYSQDGETWTQLTSGTTKDFTYSTTGTLYAKTLDASGNVTTASTYTIANIDTQMPIITISVSGKTATLTLSDTIGVTGYTVNTSNTTVNSWTSIASTKSTSVSWTASKPGTFYGWVRDGAGRTASAVITILESAFTYAATLESIEYTATTYCKGDATMDENGDCIYSNNESKCGCATYNTCKNQACGNETCSDGAVCGYNSCRNEACGCEMLTCKLFNICTVCTCTGATNGQVYTSKLVTSEEQFRSDCSAARFTQGDSGVTSCSTGRSSYCTDSNGVNWSQVDSNTECANAQSKTCKTYNTCETQACGAKTCTNAGCGYKSCQTSGCGCQTAKSCPASDQKAYKCKNETDKLSGNTCTSSEYVCEDGDFLIGTTCYKSYPATCTTCKLYPECNYGSAVSCNGAPVDNQCVSSTTAIPGTVNCDKLKAYPYEWCPNPTKGRNSICGSITTVTSSDCATVTGENCTDYTCPYGGTLNRTTNMCE
ncbi:MAG: prepilin-type N-terminal cleavage/methylation domain-containing protein [Firmicutes bacterium]|nr:prepilin-type N-terminal cleavage/methylation domain-containing protein [Bacillota bacterium]